MPVTECEAGTDPFRKLPCSGLKNHGVWPKRTVEREFRLFSLEAKLKSPALRFNARAQERIAQARFLPGIGAVARQGASESSGQAVMRSASIARHELFGPRAIIKWQSIARFARRTIDSPGSALPEIGFISELAGIMSRASTSKTIK
jgi:hypothetical protein